jgi:crotonobetainyl-CoA:carnitine CoA-transferase CaiB-like acyl-CoA transferase
LNRTEWQRPLTYKAADGGYLMVVPLTRAEWDAFWRCLDLAAYADDFGFSTRDFPPEVHDAIAAKIASRERADWVQRLTEAGVPTAPALSRTEFMDHPHPWQNHMLVESQHPEAGRVRMMNLPVRLSDTPGRAGGPAPAAGADTHAVLTEIGYTDAEIEAMCREGVVR